MNEITERVSANLRLARKDAGLTRSALADKLGCHPGALYQWETGKREMSHSSICQAAEVLGRSWLWFYQEQNKKFTLVDVSEPGEPEYKALLTAPIVGSEKESKIDQFLRLAEEIKKERANGTTGEDCFRFLNEAVNGGSSRLFIEQAQGRLARAREGQTVGVAS